MTPHPSGTSQTRSFTTVFLIEMWERFGYYGMAALLVLFMIDKLGFADSHANLTWGTFTALVFSAPAIGGWIGDKVLGARRTMIFGACVLASGYLMLSIPFDSLGYLYAALGVIVVGNGLFKATRQISCDAFTRATTHASTARSPSTTCRSISARPFQCSHRRGSRITGAGTQPLPYVSPEWCSGWSISY
ncbi:hypothetical protein ABH944_007758 [Caballeronia udeis]|uniref:Amino acid/peptide transporter n=1 Tax=Caballeronia udeis TaxID=1232866 RepID=A0ABW8MUU7_9BURK